MAVFSGTQNDVPKVESVSRGAAGSHSWSETGANSTGAAAQKNGDIVALFADTELFHGIY